ncbi:MAG: CSLREA domain-containing protein [Candidatus Binatia bacterium]
MIHHHARIRSFRSRATAGALVALALLIAASPVGAATITVDSTADELDSSGDCSLREAIRAANTNTAQDGCAAGSSGSLDTIVLANGAVYGLTKAGADDAAQVGDLDIANDTAAQDLRIEVAGNGTATIDNQLKNPTDRLLSVASGANVLLRGVIVSGGNVADGGGGLLAGTGTTVTLESCAFTGNVAGQGGGAVDFASGTLSVNGCVFTGNATLGSGGGAIRTGKTAVVAVADSVFEENDSGDFVGGAIASGPALTVSGSTFVDNRSNGAGGAIAVATSVSTPTAIGTSCFIGNADVAVVSTNSSALGANGNWWGSSDGPGGQGPGTGDSIDQDVVATSFASAPLAGCRPLELLANGGFENVAFDGRAPRWRLRRLDGLSDGVTCSQGGCALVMEGDGQSNEAVQTILAPGAAGDTVTVSATVGGKNVAASAGKFQVELSLIHADGSKQRKTLKFGSGSFADETRTKQIVAAEPFVRLKVRAIFGRASGLARFEDVSVVLE